MDLVKNEQDLRELFYGLIIKSEFECKIYLSNYSKMYLNNLFEKIHEYLLISDDQTFIEILLESEKEDIFTKINKLKYLGNKCLIYTGLYENFIKSKKLNNTDYYKMIGIKSFDILSDLYSQYKKEHATLYSQLVIEFNNIVIVLNKISKKINNNNNFLELIN